MKCQIELISIRIPLKNNQLLMNMGQGSNKAVVGKLVMKFATSFDNIVGSVLKKYQKLLKYFVLAPS